MGAGPDALGLGSFICREEAALLFIDRRIANIGPLLATAS
jgi:hypothetical protein